jgi:hypothetical protein
MTGLLTIGWTRAQAEPRTASLPETLAAFAAAAMLIASTAAGIMEQSALQSQSSSTVPTDPRTSTLPARETMVGAYTGAPYTYPSVVTIGKEGGDILTIDPVHWYTDPFKSPIYYGARVARWFTGGRAGVMVDFIHSKAIARLDREANFSGSVNGAPVGPRARLDEVVKKLEFSHGHNMLLFNGLVRLPGIGAHLSPYAGLGAGVLLPHTEVQLAEQGATRTYDYNYAGPAGQALLGIEVRLKRLSLFVEYKYTYADYASPLSHANGSWLFGDLWRQFQRWRRGEEPAGGHITTKVVSHQVVGGFAVRIASPAP